jgi:hypothetical protein
VAEPEERFAGEGAMLKQCKRAGRNFSSILIFVPQRHEKNERVVRKISRA